MSAKSPVAPLSLLYEEDFAEWAEETTRLLRERQFDEIDLENLVEETADMARRERHELLNRLAVLLHHLLKWQCQPAKRSRGWRATIAEQRARIGRLLRHSPSLRRHVAAGVTEVYGDAVEKASIQTGLEVTAFSAECPFSAEQILDRSFLPE